MGDVFKSKVRPIGSSACIIIPQEQMEKNHVRMGQEVEISLLVHKKDFSLFGSVREKFPFERDKKVREFD